MNTKIHKNDWLAFIFALLLAGLIEQSFFHGTIGVSYLLFITAFYTCFFWRFKNFSFSNRRIGLLVMVCIWFLSISYFISSNPIFYGLNLIVIPSLILVHLVLVTSMKPIKWYRLSFILIIFLKLKAAVLYVLSFLKLGEELLKRGVDIQKLQLIKRIATGLLISVPLLFIIISLLASADVEFKRIVLGVPNWFIGLEIGDVLFRIIIIGFYTMVIFGIFQTLYKGKKTKEPIISDVKIGLDTIIVLTVLLLLNSVYLLFVAVQFKYFFSGNLVGDLTYAEYARRGFFELIFITVLNLTIIVAVVTFIRHQSQWLKKAIQILLSLLIGASGIILTSAFLRLLMYENAYGFTISRVIAHSFMVFLVVILLYTLIKVWLDKISLAHFFLISALLYYTSLNVIDIKSIVVNKNIERYSQTGKIDLHYINRLSDTGIKALVRLYEDESLRQDLEPILYERKLQVINQEEYTWQSYNLTKEKTHQLLRNLDVQLKK